MNENTNNRPDNSGNEPSLLPMHCSLCGASIRRWYVSSSERMVYATCEVGHKTKHQPEWLARKAV